MKWIMRLWLVIFGIVIIWVYLLFISPKIFHHKEVTVPEMLHMTEAEAIDYLNRNHISYQITYIENSKDEVLKTIPYAGTKVKADYPIKVYIGKVMPQSYHSYLGQTYENVSEEIDKMCHDYHLRLKIEYEEDNSHMSGVIIRESLVDGSILNEGVELLLTLSKNNNVFLMPRLVGLNINDALKILEEYKMKVHINYYSTPVEEDIVLFQSTSENTLVDKNNSSILELYVSKGLFISSSTNLDFLIACLESLNYEIEINYISSNENFNKLVAFKTQKLYDIGMTKYILWVTK